MNLLRPRGEWKEAFWGLEDVSFTIAPGEVVGIIGPNGSGKSTILKLIVRILEPTRGRVSAHGRVAALLELGAGFHPDLSGRDNVYLNGSLHGMSRHEMDVVFDEIVAFAELERFIDAPVKYYSSGMFMRLGFSVGVHVRPDILLIDESLAVGDQAFQAKCLMRIHEVAKSGATIVLISHNLDLVQDLCKRAIWMMGGRVRADGTVNLVIEQYLREVLRKERETSGHEGVGAADRWGSGEIEITGVKFLNGKGRETNEFATGQPFVARMFYRASQRVEGPAFGCAIHRSDGVHINGPNTDFSDQHVEAVEAGEGCLDYIVPALPLLGGNYFFSAVAYDSLHIHAYDHQHMRYQFAVVPGGVKERYGLLYMPSRWETHHGR
ncbi:MAG: ABC transporter ATP-binding protein [Chloroflexi bacterium]|nr:ABC transporter ATP-binding protein [Chloroflexota bacterium]